MITQTSTVDDSQVIFDERKRRSEFSVRRCKSFQWKSGVVFAHSHAQNKPLPHLSIFFLTSISSSTTCTHPSDPFVEPFHSLKNAFTGLLSPIPESVDSTSINIARPSSARLLITPSSTICAADIAMPSTSNNLPAPK